MSTRQKGILLLGMMILLIPVLGNPALAVTTWYLGGYGKYSAAWGGLNDTIRNYNSWTQDLGLTDFEMEELADDTKGWYLTGDDSSANDGSEPTVAGDCDTHANNYSGTEPQADSVSATGGMACAGQRRTLKLSNSQYIWDISGNVWEWTDAYIYDNDMTHEMPAPSSGSGWTEYSTSTTATGINQYVVNYKGLNYIRPRHVWNSNNGVGRIYIDANCAYGSDGAGGYNETCGVYDHYYHAFVRGGNWGTGAYAGAFALALGDSPSGVSSNLGFRCAR